MAAQTLAHVTLGIHDGDPNRKTTVGRNPNRKACDLNPNRKPHGRNPNPNLSPREKQI